MDSDSAESKIMDSVDHELYTRDASQDNPNPESRDLGKFFDPEIPGLRRRDPGIVKIVYFVKYCQFFGISE